LRECISVCIDILYTVVYLSYSFLSPHPPGNKLLVILIILLKNNNRESSKPPATSSVGRQDSLLAIIWKRAGKLKRI
jgi:predicted phosphatase